MPGNNREYDTALAREQKALSKAQRSMNKMIKQMLTGLSVAGKQSLREEYYKQIHIVVHNFYTQKDERTNPENKVCDILKSCEEPICTIANSAIYTDTIFLTNLVELCLAHVELEKFRPANLEFRAFE